MDPVSQPATALPFDDSRARALLARRLSRVAAGLVLACGPVIVSAQWVLVHVEEKKHPLTAAPLVALLWLCAWGAARLARRFALSGRAFSFFSADAFSSASFVVPAVGVALAGPLSLHAVIGLPLWLLGVVVGDYNVMAGYDGWVALSLWGTLHVHLAFLIVMVAAARRVAQGELVEKIPLWPSVLLSLIPGILILFPPLVVWLTGLFVSRNFLRRAATWHDGDAALE